MGKVKIVCLSALTLISFIILVTLVVKVSIPNYHGSRFKKGKCQDVYSDYESWQIEWKDCSCGSTCTAQFPCVPVHGIYVDAKGRLVNGTLHEDYAALWRGCFTVPDCERDPTINEKLVWDTVEEFLNMHRSPLQDFNCWRLGTKFLTSNFYSAKKANLAFLLPLAFFIAFLALLIYSSKRLRKFCQRCCGCHQIFVFSPL